ncbi:nuclease HARBI1 [Trichonephila clavipes]|nr:nuclease HARBI1 [Trichonephila clavipes]
MGSFHYRFPTESGEFAGPNTDSADFAVLLVRFAEGTSLGLPQKISLFAGGVSQPLSLKKLVLLRGAHTSTLQNTIFYCCQGFNTAPSKTPSPLSDFLTSLIYPLSSHLIRSHYPLMFCPFSAPIGLGSFELLSLSRSHQFQRIPDHAPRAPMSGYTLCVSRSAVVTGSCRIGSKQNTSLKRLFATPRTKFRSSFPGINEKTGVSATLAARELDDYEFQRRFRLTKQSVAELTLLIEEKLESKIPCNNALNPVEQVLIALRFYAVSCMQLAIADLFDVSQPTVCRVVHRVSEAIASLLPDFIHLPVNREECKTVARKFFSIAGFPKVIGALDGTFVRIVSPGGEDAERYNKSHVLTRNTIERKYGILKRRFPCLSIGLNCHIDRIPAIVVACCVLHNLCIRLEDPEPPADPQIEALVRQLELENEDATLTFETRPCCPAGFAKRNVIVTNFFSN